MALNLIYGNSGSGKSTYIFEKTVRMAAEQPRRNFYVIVPEQFTMQAQRELVRRSGRGVILNIDVVSFQRLAYRIFDELGIRNTVLEETGKSLVLRRIAEQKIRDLKVLGGNIRKMGYIGEIKSMISELMQYDVSVRELGDFLEGLPARSALRLKLSDIHTLYEAFEEYLEEGYVTAERVLEVLMDAAEDSALLRDAVMIFDGFTGFTPVQMKLLRRLMQTAAELYVTVTMDAREQPLSDPGIQDLFYMSRKMTRGLLRAAREAGFPVEEPVFLDPARHSRLQGNPVLAHLEQNLFRARSLAWEGDCGGALRAVSLATPRAELEFAAAEICRLTREKGYRYRDFAIVSGDVELYGNYADSVFGACGIPCFVDRKQDILYHPAVDLIRAALEMVEKNFSYESVFRYLRTGLGGFSREETDLLENYVIARGVRGVNKWSAPFRVPPRGRGRLKTDEERQGAELEEAERLRGCFWEQVKPLYEAFTDSGATLREQTLALYEFLCSLSLEQRLDEERGRLESEGKEVLASEYRQIYKMIIDLLDKMTDLLGDEKLTVRDYADVLEAGFSTAKVGSIPPGNDCVILGDIERSRLEGIRVLFFVGVNDGIIPRNADRGGILSQYDREVLESRDLELAPTAREQAFIQRFYLYLNLTKPSDALYLTCARMDEQQKSARPSYLMGTVQRMFPRLVLTEAEAGRPSALSAPRGSLETYLDGLLLARRGTVLPWWKALHRWYMSHEAWAPRVSRLFDAAFGVYRGESLEPELAGLLYGGTLTGSVTRLELYARCAYAHFLEYGLRLSEREEYGFAAVDMGSMFHEILMRYCLRLEASEDDWFTVTEETQEELLDAAMEETVRELPGESLLESPRGFAVLERMRRVMMRSIRTLTGQVRRGSFRPAAYEMDFSMELRTAFSEQGSGSPEGKDRSQKQEENFPGENDNSVEWNAAFPERKDREQGAGAQRGSLRPGGGTGLPTAPGAAPHEPGSIRLVGRIDRMDLYEEDGRVYVRIIDYKSGNTTFQLLNLYYGQQLQLAVYLDAAMEKLRKEHPDKQVLPGGIFYYRMGDPMVEAGESDAEEIEKEIFGELRLNGLLNLEPEVFRHMDSRMAAGEQSDVIPLKLNKDGSVGRAGTSGAGQEDFARLGVFVRSSIRQSAGRILEGDIHVGPSRLDQRTGCDYCPYRSVCGFDPKIPGYGYEEKPKLKNEDIWKEIRGEESE